MPTSPGIIVLGPYRSGTSVTAQVLHALGVDFGPKRKMVPPHDWNPGGHFERWDINDANDALVSSAGKTLGDPGDPRELAKNADPKSFELADMSWQKKRTTWGIKDPRLCVTLLTWLEHGKLDRESIKIIHVRRGVKAALKSALLCPPVMSFCGNTEPGAEHMLKSYADWAQWHVDTMGIPTFTFDYERLLQQPKVVVKELANYLGVTDERRIAKATRIIGKGNGRFRLQLERYFIRGPIRVLKFLTGRGSLRRR